MSLLKRAIDEELARRRRAARADPENLAARDKSSRQDIRAIQGKPTLSDKQLRLDSKWNLSPALRGYFH